MSTLRLRVAGTVMLALLVGVGGAALAQMEEGNGGFALKDVELAWEDGTMQPAEGFVEVTGNKATMVVEASDPRLSGTWTEVVNCREDTSRTLFMVCLGSVRVENEGGTWLGTVQMSGASFWHPSPHWSGWTVLEGQGDYAGLTAVRHFDEERMGEGDINGEGVIFDFGMPPMPDPIELSTE